MKKICTVLIVLFFSMTSMHSQTKKKVSPKELKTIIKKIADSLEYYYVDLEMGKKIGLKLTNNEKQGNYSAINNPDTIAHRLTKDIRSVNRDVHLFVGHKPLKTTNTINNNDLDNYTSALASNYGIPEIKILENNIGYMKIASFSNWNFFEQSQALVTVSMKFLENSDAIIFDVRNNRGGVPNLVAFLCSYLFEEEPVHLAQYYHRYRNDGYGLYTNKYIPGKRLTKVPVFILVNKKSASAAEEFAYFLKHQKRAVVIGEATMGAGYGVMTHRLNDRFVVSISSEEDINPITKSNFEGVGVIPNIQTEKENAFYEAKRLAEKAASIYKVEKDKNLKTLLDKYALIDASIELTEIITIIKQCHLEGLIGRSNINQLGYKFLNNYPSIAEGVFELNTKLNPKSSNVFDSYGDALKALGKLEEALNAYKKAIEIGEVIGSSNLSIYLANLKNTEKLMADKNKDK